MPVAATHPTVRRAPPRFADPPKLKRGRPPKAVSDSLPPYDLGMICGLLRDGETLTEIAKAFRRSRDSLRMWALEDPARKLAIDEARHEGAHAYVEKAGAVLAALTPGATKATIARARELAQHYRWMASKMLPKTYGERVELDGHVSVDPLTVLVQQIQANGSRIPLRGISPGGITDIEPRALPSPPPPEDADDA